MMNRRATNGLLRWTLRRDNNLMTCRIDPLLNGRRYQLAMIPHSLTGGAAIETFDSVVSALRRHAEIVSELRQLGWTLVEYSGPFPGTPDQHPLAAAA